MNSPVCRKSGFCRRLSHWNCGAFWCDCFCHTMTPNVGGSETARAAHPPGRPGGWRPDISQGPGLAPVAGPCDRTARRRVDEIRTALVVAGFSLAHHHGLNAGGRS